MRHGLLSFATVITSSSTLLCCAVPALLVALGAGSALAGLMSAYPALSLLSTHKNTLFAVSAVLLMINGVWQHRQRHAPCPVDPVLARACRTTRRTGRIMYGISVVVFAIGFCFAFVFPLFFPG